MPCAIHSFHHVSSITLKIICLMAEHSFVPWMLALFRRPGTEPFWAAAILDCNGFPWFLALTMQHLPVCLQLWLLYFFVFPCVL